MRKDRRYDRSAVLAFRQQYGGSPATPKPAAPPSLPQPEDDSKYLIKPGFSLRNLQLTLISKRFSVFVYSVSLVAFTFLVVQVAFFAYVYMAQAEEEPQRTFSYALQPATVEGWEGSASAVRIEALSTTALKGFTEKNSAFYLNTPAAPVTESVPVPTLQPAAPLPVNTNVAAPAAVPSPPASGDGEAAAPATTPANTSEVAPPVDANSNTNPAPSAPLTTNTEPPAAANTNAPAEPGSPVTAQGTVLGTETSATTALSSVNPVLVARGFALPRELPADTQLTEATLVVSFGADSYAGNEDVVTFSASADGGQTWQVLESFGLNDTLSNATHGGYWEYPLADTIGSLDKISQVQFRAEYHAVPAAGKARAYLDGVRLQVHASRPDPVTVAIQNSVAVRKKGIARGERAVFDVAVEERSGLSFLGARGTTRTVKGVEITDPAGKPVTAAYGTRDVRDGRVTTAEYTFDTDKFRQPGQYTVTMTVEQDGTTERVTQTFIWGALAMNPDQSLYKKGETATFSIGALDEHGGIVCTADVTLTITDPSGKKTVKRTADKTIEVTDFCGKKELYQKQDMIAREKLTRSGTYSLDLTATVHGNASSLSDTLMVEDAPAYTIQRQGPTRVFPNIYQPMKLEVMVRDDFRGTIKESFPIDFDIKPENGGYNMPVFNGTEIVRYIAWDVDLKAGSTVTLGYMFKSPEKSPALYTLGPATVGDWQEHRAWQLAIDPALMYLLGTTTPAPSGWTTNTTFNGYYPRGAATTDSTPPSGGAASHTHTITDISVLPTNTGTTKGCSKVCPDFAPTYAHTHISSSTNVIGSKNNDPLNYNFYLWASNSTYPTLQTIPQNAIAFFDAAPTAGSWTQFNSANNRLVKINSSSGTGGTEDTHQHTLTWNSITNATGSTGTTDLITDALLGPDAATHTHTAPSPTTSEPYTSVPSNIDTMLYQASANNSIPQGVIAMFDSDPGADWTTVSGASQTFNAQFIGASSSYSATPQSSDTHSMIAEASGESGSNPNAGRDLTFSNVLADDYHTHAISILTAAGQDHKPQYFDVIMAKCTKTGGCNSGASTITVSGSAYSDEGSTKITSAAKTVTLWVNGSATACGGACTAETSGGDYTINNVTAVSGDVLTLFLDNETEKATTFLVSNGATVNTAHLYQNRVILRHDTGASITNANIESGDRDATGETDILAEVA
ncbi:MAG: hypothetical protein V1916_01505, partial [Patescibacteria group bacterium]